MKQLIAGCFSSFPDVEDRTREYVELTDGLRLIFMNGKYVGFYNPCLTEEG